MSTGYTRCLYISDGQQCEKWFPANGKEFCERHDGLGVEIVDINREREFCYQFFADIKRPTLEEIGKLDEHIASIEAVIEAQKLLFYNSRAVRREALDNLSEDERKERLKYVPKKPKTLPKDKQPKPKPAAFKKGGDLEKHLSAKGISAADLLNLDEDELIAKFNEAKKAKP